MNGKKKKRKIRIKGVILIILVIYVLVVVSYYFLKIPVKNITIIGNTYLKDNYIINKIDVINKPISKINKREIKKELLNIDIISDAKISKNLLGNLKITLTEDKVLFYNYNNDKLILENGREIPYNDNYLGIPSLINYVPDDIYNELVLKMKIVNDDVLKNISEIEYNPSLVQDKVIDDRRFLFRMNDGNQVYINTINMEKINNYLEIYELIVNKNGMIKGCLYLDSNSDNKYFNNCEEKIIDSNLDNGGNNG